MKKIFLDKKGFIYMAMFIAILYTHNVYAITTLGSKIIYVSQNSYGNNDGTSWDNAYGNLQDALDNALYRDTILVAAGNYYPTKDKNDSTSPTDIRTLTFFIPMGVSVIGGFESYPQYVTDPWKTRDLYNNQTILNGNIGTPSDTDNCYHVVEMGDSTKINGIIVRGGYANGNSNDYLNMGGGIHIIGRNNVKISYCEISNNFGIQAGGISVYAANPTANNIRIKRCVFDNDSTNNGGGAISLWNSPALVSNCIFVDNSSQRFGSAIYNWGSGATSTIVNCDFIGNAAYHSTDNGVIHSRGVTSTVANCIFYLNTGNDIDGTYGGGSSVSYSCIQQTGYSGSNGNFSGDPKFKDLITNNIHLISSSPCIDAANASLAPNYDYDHHNRVDVSNVSNTGAGTPNYGDVGVYEFTQDVGVINWTGNTDLCNISTTLAVSVMVYNYSDDTVTNVPINYIYDGGNVVSGIVPSISPNSSTNYTFSSTINGALGGYHNLEVYSTYGADVDATNDTLFTTWTNTPNIVSFPVVEDFESGAITYFTFNHNKQTDLYIQVEDGIGKNDSKGLEIHGSPTYNYSWNYPQNVTSAFQNTDYMTKLFNCSVNASGQSHLTMSFDLKQSRSWDANNCWFRVMINDSIYVKTFNGDSVFQVPNNQTEKGYEKYVMDLSSFAGMTFSLSFEAITYVYQPGYDEDFVRIDNINIWNRSATDVGLIDITSSSNDSDCGAVIDSVYAEIKNFGYSAVSNIPVTGTIGASDGTHSYNATFTGTLQPFQDTLLYLGTLNTAQFGAFDIKMATALPGDTIILNDSLSGIAYNDRFDLPYVDNLDDLVADYDNWDNYNNAQFGVATNTSNKSNAIVFNVYGGQNGGFGYSVQSSKVFGPITSKSQLIFDYYYNQNMGSDTFFVEVSNDCKTTWNVVAAYSSAQLPQNSEYTHLSLDVSSYANDNIYVRFRIAPYSGYYNFYIDNPGIVNKIDLNIGNDTTLCGGDSLTLVSGLDTASYNHEWYSLGNGNILSTDSFFIVFQTGYYICKASDIYGSYDSDTIYVNVLPKPTASFISDSTAICGTGQINLGIVFNGANPFVFQMTDNISSIVTTDTSQSFYTSLQRSISATSQFKIVSLTDNNGCIYTNDIDSMQAISYPLPNPVISGLSSSYCSDAPSVNVGISPSGGTLSGSGIVGNSFSPSLAGIGSNDIIYKVTDINNCSNSDTVQVVVNPTPNVNFTANLSSSYCVDGDTVVLSALPVGGVFSGSGVVGNVFYPNQASAGPVDIIYTYSDIHGCGGADTVSTTVYSLPNVTLSAMGNECANGQPIVLSGGSPSGGTYSGDGVAQGVLYPSIAPIGNDTIVYSFIDSHGCKNSAEVYLTINPVPIASFTIPASICDGDSAHIVYTGTTTASTYWDFDGGQILSGTANGPYNINWATTGPKVIRLVASENGCVSDTAIKLTNILSSFAQATAVGNTTVCYGDSVVIFANTGINYNYQWYNSSGTMIGDTLSYYIANQSDTFYCEVINGNGCPAVSNSIAVVVQPLVTADFILPTTACEGNMVNITYNGSSGASAIYNWNFDNGVIASGSGQGPYSIIWNTDSIKNVSLTVTENGCASQPESKAITILSEKATISALGGTSFCDGDSVVLYANAGSYNYNWKRNGISLGVNAPLYTASQSGYYSVDITNTNTGCANESDSINIIANTTDFGLAFTANPTTFTIPPFNTQFTNQTASSGNYYWQWDLGDGNTSTLVSPNHQYMFDGSYTVSVFAENINTGCRDTLVKSNYISCTGGSVNPCNLVASITPSGSATICPGDTLLLKATYNSGANYQWLKDGVIISGATDSTFYATQVGMYQIMVSNSTCSQFSQAFALSQYSVITPTIVVNGSIMPCTNDSMELQVPTYFNNYLWTNGATTQSIYVKSSGNYEVTVTDANGCKTTSNPYVVNASLLQTPEICIVGVDSATNHNVVIWERQANALIDSFNIYRETVVAGVYSLIGSKPITSPGIFMDTASNPLQRAYRYKITAVDTCGQETPPSQMHQTIHLNINAGLNGSWNLIWEGYKGFNFGSYRIYRGGDSTNMQLLTQIQSTLNSYTDLNPPTGKVYYQIEVESPHPCYPDSIYSKAKTNYNTSRSNRVNTTMAPNTGMGLQVQNNLRLNIFPNPNNGLFTLAIKYPGKLVGDLKIFNSIGEIVYSESVKFNDRLDQNLDLRHLSKGVYFVRIQTDNELITGKIVIQ